MSYFLGWPNGNIDRCDGYIFMFHYYEHLGLLPGRMNDKIKLSLLKRFFSK